MKKLFAPFLIGYALLISFSASAGPADTDGALLAGIPDPPNSKPLGAGAVASGGQKASFTSSAEPAAVVAAYMETLPTVGWAVTGSVGGGSSYGGGAVLRATKGPNYLVINAGGPAGTTFVNICVWSSKAE
jgi:hypothetical protein